MRSKELAKRPKKLEQQKMNLFLDYDSDEEEVSEEAAGSAAGSRQATSSMKK